MKLTIIGSDLPHIPWQPRARGNSDLLWRDTGNPVIGRRPRPHVTGIHHSAVVSSKKGFIAADTASALCFGNAGKIVRFVKDNPLNR